MTEAERRAPRVYRLLEDQPPFRLKAGDLLLCIPYWLDPDKVTVLERATDHYDPSCTLYRYEVEVVA